MITQVTGKVNRVQNDELSMAIGAFEYQVLIPEFARLRLQNRVGEEVSLYTIQYLEGNPTQGRLTPRIVGFLTEIEREFFELDADGQAKAEKPVDVKF